MYSKFGIMIGQKLTLYESKLTVHCIALLYSAISERDLSHTHTHNTHTSFIQWRSQKTDLGGNMGVGIDELSKRFTSAAY